MLRFLFFLATIVIIWYILNAVLRNIRVVFGGRRPRRNNPDGEQKAAPGARTTVELHDVKDAEFKDLPPGDMKGGT